MVVPAPPPEDDLPSFAELTGPDGEVGSPALEQAPETTDALASLARVRTDADEDFLKGDYELRRVNIGAKKVEEESSCDEDSEEAHGVAYLHLGEETVDFANAEHVNQVKGQVQPGDTMWFSIPCTEHTRGST